MAIPEERNNPYAAFNFKVSANGQRLGGFMECSGLDSETAPIEYREGDDQSAQSPGNAGAFVRKLPGLESYPNVMLKRGLTGNKDLWEWRRQVRDANPSPAENRPNAAVREVVITLLDEKHQEVFKWRLENAWPCKLTGPTLNAQGNELAVEQLELCCERIEVVEE